MNERITRLIIEANNYAIEKCPIPVAADGVTKELIVSNRFGESQRKLAELIVKECAEFVSDDRQNDEYGQFVANRIKQHFGVEE
jgi:hypothetical protein